MGSIKQRLNNLENEKLVRQCMNCYMHLCDLLDANFELFKLTSLFTNDAVWEGKGKRYGGTFGRHEGKQAITKMFEKYTKPPAHFVLNVHYLCNELIDVDGITARGTWILVQPSTFANGNSQLSSAKITASFIFENGTWLIKHFQTENLFSRPVSESWDNSKPLPVPD